MQVLTYRSEKAKKVEKLDPKILHCKSCDAFLTYIVVFYSSSLDEGCRKTKILHFQQFHTAMLTDSTFDKLNIIGHPGFVLQVQYINQLF